MFNVISVLLRNHFRLLFLIFKKTVLPNSNEMNENSESEEFEKCDRRCLLCMNLLLQMLYSFE